MEVEAKEEDKVRQREVMVRFYKRQSMPGRSGLGLYWRSICVLVIR